MSDSMTFSEKAANLARQWLLLDMDQKRELLMIFPFTLPVMLYAGVGIVTVDEDSEFAGNCLKMYATLLEDNDEQS